MSESSFAGRAGAPFARRTGWLDTLIAEADRALRVLGGTAGVSRAYPAGAGATQLPEPALSPAERRHAAGLMRVNHVGEICAQALYRGQAAVCRDEAARTMLRQAASEEVDHLDWCARRLRELDSPPSLLNPFWYASSFGLGVLAGCAGVRRNLGFMAETERQVEAHLDTHLRSLPVQDSRSRRIVEQMRTDEIGHRVAAERQGAALVPAPGRLAMRLMSRVMTSTAYWI